MMRSLRAGLRMVAITATTTFVFLMLLGGNLVTAPVSQRRVRWRNFWFRNWAQVVLAVMGATVEYRGTPPRPPFFLVTNHLSYVDIPVLASLLDAVFIAKSEVASWPLVGSVCRSAGTLFVDRTSHRDLPRVVEAIDRTLQSDQGVVLFPEGTSTRGAEVVSFRPSLLEVAARGPHPVSYASLGYRTGPGVTPAHESVCWWGDMKFAGHLWDLLALPGFTATVVFGDAEVRESDRKQLATKLRQEVGRLFTPVVSPAVGSG